MRPSSLLALTLLCLAGCAEDEGPDSMTPMEPEAPPAGDTYVAGLEKTGANAQVQVRLIDALPAPPELGDNQWELEIVDMSGATLEGCALEIEPRMPAHGHGANKTAAITEVGAGRYQATPVDLFMPGLWVTQVRVDCDGVTDTVTYEFWIEG